MIIRNDGQIQQIICDTETIFSFIDNMDPKIHADILYFLKQPNRRVTFMREVIADPVHNYGVNPVTTGYLEKKLIRQAGTYVDFMEFFTGE